MDSCIFCTLFAARMRKAVYEDDLFWGIYDIHPVSPGHMLLIPKRHVVALRDLTEAEWRRLFFVQRKAIARIVKDDLKSVYEELVKQELTPTSTWFAKRALKRVARGEKPHDFNHGINDGPLAGRTVEHFHWHIIPRYKDDVNDPRGGVRYVVPQMGNYESPHH
jgi:diadenosine tetraphosphate (Ap4A) HIT family hydrolase